MVFAAPTGAPDKVCVEAETDPGGGVVLTLCDITLRRFYVRTHGRHTAHVSREALHGYGFPMQYLDALKDGYPVRFRMNLSGFEKLLGVGLGGLEGHPDEPEGTLVFHAKAPDGREVKVIEVRPGTYAVRGYSVTRFIEGGEAPTRILPHGLGREGLYVRSMLPDILERMDEAMGPGLEVELDKIGV